MKKTTFIGIFAVLLLVVGMVFVSAELGSDEVVDNKEAKANACGQLTCGEGSCNGACGGSCDVPKCGCGR